MNTITSNFDIDSQFDGTQSYFIDASSNNITITLPVIVDASIFIFTRVDSSNNIVTIQSKPNYTIRGLSSLNLGNDNIASLQRFGINWFVTRVAFT